MRKRRECRVLSKSDLLTAFENANTRIISKYAESTALLSREGISLLRKLTADFLKQEPNSLAEFPSFQPLQHHLRPELCPTRVPEQKKNLEEQHDMNDGRVTFSQSQEQDPNETCKFGVQASERKPIFTSAVSKREIDSTTKKLSKSFKKLGIDERYFTDEDDEDSGENTNHMNLPNYDHMTVAEIVEESNRKLQQRILEREANDSDSSYPITEYSSNNSSNDNTYDEEFKESFEVKQPESVVINNSNCYKPSNILYSPVKSKSQAKQKRRLYIRQKKIPKWAEDMQQVNENVIAQQNDFNLNLDDVYGLCVVQHLDINVMFNSNIKYYRGSSAKWNKKMSQFVT